MQLLNLDDTLPDGTLALTNTDDPRARAADILAAPAVTLDFPAWVDGRAYSQAVVLRGRLKYGGQIIAVGEVMVDMLPLLRRCGFDAARLGPGQSHAAAERSLGFFPAHYQGDPGRRLSA
jgi:uncharacterized protein (DUF934 family)